MTRLSILLLALLGFLAGPAKANAMDGEAVGRLSLQVVGFLVSAFLFSLVFRRRDDSEFANAARPTSGEFHDGQQD